MYATAHRVTSPQGTTGINSFLHRHSPGISWPSEPWRLPEENPGTEIAKRVEITPGGNTVLSYLDVIAPEGTPPAEVDRALTGLWSELTAATAGLGRSVPNPVVYQRGAVALRFGVVATLAERRARELAELRRRVEFGSSMSANPL